ncbi:MAG: hypothetical protein R3D55_18890 [Chloroflexota bacterium]
MPRFGLVGKRPYRWFSVAVIFGGERPFVLWSVHFAALWPCGETAVLLVFSRSDFLWETAVSLVFRCGVIWWETAVCFVVLSFCCALVLWGTAVSLVFRRSDFGGKRPFVLWLARFVTLGSCGGNGRLLLHNFVWFW